jgi:glycerol-3-phosphate acyltransferase PlsY
MTILILILSYILGSVPFALIIGKTFYKTDIRNHGSGNLGGTNTFRTLGKKAGFAVSIADISKGCLAATLPFFFGLDLHPLVAGLPAIIGHSYPIFANFKGGKSVATTAGVLLVVEPFSFLIALCGFLLTLKLTKYVSFSSITAIVLVTIYSMINSDVYMQVFSILFSAFIIFKHRTNLKRIKELTEPKVKWI